MPAGQGRRQLAEPEGRRGAFPGACAPCARLRRRRGGDGLRRGRPGRHGGAQGGHPRSRLRPAHGCGGLCARGHHPRCQRARRGDGSGRARPLRARLPRGAALAQAALPGRAPERRPQQSLLRLSRQRHRARGDAGALPQRGHRRGARHGHRQRGAARPAGGSAASAARACRGCTLLSAARRHRAADPLRRGRGGQDPARAGRGRLAGERGGRAPRLRAEARHPRASRSRPGRGPRGRAQRAGRDRGPADGWHERGGRSLRRGQDVPAPGGQERARDEAGRGLAAAAAGSLCARRRRAAARS